jgi:uridine phosphorylase
LVLNPDGSVYHLKIRPENLAENIILVGDPGRVSMISNFFDTLEFKSQNREILTHTGYYAGKRITVLSTGMGTDNIDIVLNELDALVNIDLKTRTINPQKKSLRIIRIGTSGGLQPDLPVNSFVVSNYGLGFDGLIHYYANNQSGMDAGLTNSILHYFDWTGPLPKPYGVQANAELLKLFTGKNFHNGITATASGFYGPQGRILRLGLAFPDFNRKLMDFEYLNFKILNFEMETSALYALGRLLGHKTLTICVAIANREKKVYAKNYKDAMNELIEILLSKI